MEVNIDADAIQDAVVRAIADSAIGEQVREVITTQLTAKDNGWDSETILQKSIKSEVTRLISIIVRQEIESRKDAIRELITPQITDEAIKQMGSAAIEVMLGNLSRA